MAGPRPQDNYNPTQSVNPQVGMPNDYLSARATPQAFGAQIGQGEEKVGQALGQVGQEGIETGIQYQGVLNEHAANMAELELATKGGDVYNKYKTLTGLDAANAKDKAVSDYLSVNAQIRANLGNPAAQRAYDQLAARRMSYTIQDMNGYAAQQTIKAFQEGRQASKQLSIDRAGQYDVAANPQQFSDEMANVIHQTNSDFTNPIGGKYQTLPVSQGKNGRLVFDTDTPQGRVAQADYDNTLNQDLGKMWKNRELTLAFDARSGNISTAVDDLEKNKDKIPNAIYAELSHMFHGPYQQELARSVVDQMLSNAHYDYNTKDGSTPDITSVFAQQESGNGKTSINIGQIQPDTWKEFAKPGEDITKAADNRAVMTRILSKYESDYNGDLSRVAVAYFSGPGNVAPAGSSTPWKEDRVDRNGKSVSSYVQDITNKAGGGFLTNVDYVSQHEPELIQNARDYAKNTLGLDATGQDLFAQRMETRINEVRSAQQGEVRAYKDKVASVVMNEKQPLTSEAQLDYSNDPQVRAAWINLQSLDPWGAQAVRARIAANAKGLSKTLGTDFYDRGLLPLLQGKVKDVDDLQSYFGGDNAPISASGINQLQKIQQEMRTPQGEAFAHQEAEFLEKARATITGSNIDPTINPAARLGVYNKWLATVLPQIEAARADGKGSEIFDPNNKSDYVGKSILAPTVAEIIKATEQSSNSEAEPTTKTAPQNATQIDPSKITDKDTLFKAARAGMSRKDFDATAIRLGLVDTGPKVPFNP